MYTYHPSTTRAAQAILMKYEIINHIDCVIGQIRRHAVAAIQNFSVVLTLPFRSVQPNHDETRLLLPFTRLFALRPVLHQACE